MNTKEWVDEGLRALAIFVSWPAAIVVLTVAFKSELRQATKWLGGQIERREVSISGGKFKAIFGPQLSPPQKAAADAAALGRVESTHGDEPESQALAEGVARVRSLAQQFRDAEAQLARRTEGIDASEFDREFAAARIAERVRVLLPLQANYAPAQVSTGFDAQRQERVIWTATYPADLAFASARIDDAQPWNRSLSGDFADWKQAGEFLRQDGVLVSRPPFPREAFMSLAGAMSLTLTSLDDEEAASVGRLASPDISP